MTKPAFARVGPVHFQPLESELMPVAPYLKGKLLNAGCGRRDISTYLLANGMTELVNYDLASSLPGAVLGPLEAMPFADDEFDAVLCNAVLEHTERHDLSLAEMVRVLKPGGHLVVTIPFLQPLHLCPTDFRRFTRDGIAQLGVLAGLEVVAVLPVHSIAQTIGWILWEYAQERSRWHRALLWPIIHIATRLFHRTDPTLVRNASAYQAIYRRSH